MATEARRVESLSEDAVGAEVMRVLAAAFPEVNVPPPASVLVTRWSTDRLFGGAYSFLPTAALPDGFERLQARAATAHTNRP